VVLAILSFLGWPGLQAQEPPVEVGATPAASAPSLGGTLLIVGGGVIPDEIRVRFVALAGGPTAKVVVIPASPRGGEPVRASFSLAMWKDAGVNSVSLLHAHDREQADDPKFAEELTTASAVWLGGGQQSWFSQTYAGTEVERQLHALLGRGGVIGGTSAGAAVMSRVMIVSGRDHPIEGRGFGLLPDVVIDQHFLRRSRVNRLLELLEKHPDHVGLGIDERTALEVPLNQRRVKVLGDSYVFACVPPGSEQPLRFRVLKAGDELELNTLIRTPVADTASPARSSSPAQDMD
jgi:cyanophycinase